MEDVIDRGEKRRMIEVLLQSVFNDDDFVDSHLIYRDMVIVLF